MKTCLDCEWFNGQAGTFCIYECPNLKETKQMDNVEINVKVNGKSVPIDTISTETFEKVKDASKPKEIPAVRTCCHRHDSSDKKVIIKVTKGLRKECEDADYLVLALHNGKVTNYWSEERDQSELRATYVDVKPLE